MATDTSLPHLAVWLLLNVRPFYSEAVQKPWMCQCTYCKDVYVGLIWLRVIYLPKDHNVTLEISGEIYLKICSILFVTLAVIKAKDQHRKVFLVFTSAILLFQSQPGKTAITAGAQYTTIQATGNPQSEIIHTHLQLFHVS